MAASTLRHTDDGGALSIFASEKEVLFACEKGHWWIVDASSTGVVSKTDAKEAAEGSIPRPAGPGHESLTMLNDRFGKDVFSAMNPE
jgi:hypothetical protein